MITEKTIQFFLDIFLNLTSGLEDITISIPEALLGKISDFFAFIFWFLPMDTVYAILTITMALMVFRITISFIKTIWQLLPVV